MEKGAKKTKSNLEDESQTEIDPSSEDSFRQEKIGLKVEKIKNNYEQGTFEYNITKLALKSETTYLIATSFSYSGRIQLILENTEIYSGNLTSQESKGVSGLFYASHHDCFYIITRIGKIYKKDIDDQPATLYMSLPSDHVSFLLYPDCMRYSKINKKMLMLTDSRQLSVIDLDEKRVE